MNKKKLIGILIIIIIILFMLFATILIISLAENKNSNEQLYSKLYDKFDIIIQGDTLDANMGFIDNYNNQSIRNTYMNLSKNELISKGFVEYIQQTDYMIKFYSKITIQDIEIIDESDDEFEIKVFVKRPNLMDIMNECDKENANNPNYKYNEAAIDKMDLENFSYNEDSYNIIVHKIDETLLFEYTEEFRNMLYGENN